ncbi:diaminopimelate decarboxylase [Geobacillus subterraneus]|uniref:Diaminopimelate decarboxylase n=2 Tax=Geobacillus TaxID=129337 RepID=A0ABM6AE58_9BACL|nr:MULTISPECIES: type III PLP-dependent enzyme [Geobacillus]AMX84633.1 diaminopimelate decarboxylase [Geobacillus subterraneus]KZS24835.1 diaminopimelate decarboxylase [Geobacillus subterraneus]OXB85455.1 diaminopimelate decarboxylase [Geobacillus uzenensis]
MERLNTVIQTIASRKTKQRSPLCAYVYDLEGLRAHTASLSAPLPPSVQLFYAVKANADEHILKTVAPHVTGFEVASGGELQKVRRLFSDAPVIFGGPGKTDEELIAALEARVALIHIESLWELQRLSWIAAERQTTARVLLRVNLRQAASGATLHMAGKPTQFGIDERHIAEAIYIALALPSVDLQGFHFHSMSNHTDEQAHLSFIETCLSFVAQAEKTYRRPFSVVNVGGGVGIHYSDPDRPFHWDWFAKELNLLLRRHASRHWTVIFELGRLITAHSGYYAAEVLDLKNNYGTYFAILRGGTHHLRLPAAWKMNHPFLIIPVNEWPYPFDRPSLFNERVTLAGELCTPNDVLARDVPCARLRVGDIVLFRCAGAYGWDISHHDFLSHPHPEFIYLEPST